MIPDQELHELFAGDPELMATAQRLRAARPEPVIDPRFHPQLRHRLMVRAAGQLQPRRSRWWRMPTGLAWAGATAGAAVAAAVLINLVNSHPHDQVTFVTASSPLTGQPAVTDDLMTVSFTQPMDHSAVIAGLHIRPATAVRATWRGDELVITPVHHLSPNTPYTLTIDEASARAANGSVVRGGVRIAFGTAPTPAPTPAPPAPATPPPLTLTAIGAVADPSPVLFGPAGALLAAHGVAPGATPAAPTLLSLTPDGKARSLGPAAITAAFSPDGKHLASAVAGGGGADIVIGQADSAAGAVVAHSDTATTDLAWMAPDRVLFVSGGQINAVGLSGPAQAIAPAAAGGPVLLAPNGLSAIVLPAADNPAPGVLLDLVSKAGRELRGSRSVAAFSPDGRTIAWFDGDGIVVSPAAQDQPVTVPVDPAGGPPTALALSNDATKLAYTTAAVTSVAQVPSGHILAAAAGTNPAFSSTGDRLAMVVPGATAGAFSVATAPLPAPPATMPAPAPVPAPAAALIDRFLNAQVHGDTATLLQLSGGDRSLVQRTPRGLSRSNITAATTRADDTVTALVELIADPSPAHAASTAIETLSLTPGSAGGYAITATIAPLAVQPPGPHVAAVQPDGTDAREIDVRFDSDLDPATVVAAITLRTPGGAAAAATVVYNADTRTATITPRTRGPEEAEVTVATTLTDISGQHLTVPFVTTYRWR